MEYAFVKYVSTAFEICVIEQYFITAFEKMLQGMDGFFYELIDGKYIRKHHFNIDFQNIRLRILYSPIFLLKS